MMRRTNTAQAKTDGSSGQKGAPGGFSRALRVLGPGIVTGAADDDPSGIATYAQAGAQYGSGLLWTVPVTRGMSSRYTRTIGYQQGCRHTTARRG